MCFEFTQADIDRFMAKVDQLPNGCWYWMGARSRGRGRRWYGTFHVSGYGSVRAHKFAAIALGNGYTPGNHLSHNCHFSMCVCPEHIDDIAPELNQALKSERR